jgi:RNA-binding protein PNO1
MTPLKNAWMSLYTPITEHLKLDMRMNLKTKKVSCTPAVSSIAKHGKEQNMQNVYTHMICFSSWQLAMPRT